MKTLLLAALLSATPAPPPDATTTQRGLVNTKAQAFSGLKHFDGGIWTPTINGVPVETTAAVTLFVDTAGNDSNACTDGGVFACLTPQGAINKLPKILRHRVTLNLASGSYPGVTIAGFSVDPKEATSGIVIQGTLGLATLASGAAAGVVESSTTGSGVTFGTVTTDAGWTSNDLRNRFLVNDAGTIRVVSTNTNNTATVVGTWSGVSGTTWQVMEPSTIITSAAAASTGLAAAGIQIAGNSPLLTTTVRNVKISIPATSAPFLVAGPQVASFSNVVLTNSYTATPTASQGATVSVTGSAFITANSPLASTSGASLQATNCMATATRGYQALDRGALTLTTAQVNETSTNTACAIAATGGRLTVSTMRCDCASGANGVAVLAGGLASTAFGGSGEAHITGPVDVTNCNYGVQAWHSRVHFATGVGFTGNALVYAAHAIYGGSIILSNTTPTITSAGAEVAVDSGAGTGTFASIPAAYNCLAATTGTGSTVCRQ